MLLVLIKRIGTSCLLGIPNLKNTVVHSYFNFLQDTIRFYHALSGIYKIHNCCLINIFWWTTRLCFWHLFLDFTFCHHCGLLVGVCTRTHMYWKNSPSCLYSHIIIAEEMLCDFTNKASQVCWENSFFANAINTIKYQKEGNYNIKEKKLNVFHMKVVYFLFIYNPTWFFIQSGHFCKKSSKLEKKFMPHLFYYSSFKHPLQNVFWSLNKYLCMWIVYLKEKTLSAKKKYVNALFYLPNGIHCLFLELLSPNSHSLFEPMWTK